MVKLKQSRNSPGVAHRVTGGWGPQISWHSAREGSEVVSLTPPIPWTEKTIEKSLFFSDAKVIAAAKTWLDGQIYEFFWVACVS
jgi:hypothetical protein